MKQAEAHENNGGGRFQEPDMVISQEAIMKPI